MPLESGLSIQLKKGGLAAIHQAIFNAVKKTFEGPITDEAKERSPKDTGENAESIRTQVEDRGKEGIHAEVFTTSGYGGYIELGHKVRGDSGAMVEGVPYIHPAVMNHAKEIAEETRRNITIAGTTTFTKEDL